MKHLCSWNESVFDPQTNVLFVLLPFTIFTAGSTTTLFQHVLQIFLVGYLSHLLWLARSGRPSLRSLDGNVLPVGETWLTVENPSGGCLYAAVLLLSDRSAWMAGSSRSENCRNFSRVRQQVCLFIAAANLVDRDLFFKARNFVSS